MLASATRTLASTGGVYSISRTNVARVPLASWLFFSTWLQPSGIRRRPNLQSHIHLLRGITCFSATRLLMSIDHVAGWLLRVARNRITDLFGLALKLIRHRYGCAAGCAAWALPRRYVLVPIGLCPWCGLGPIVPLPSVNFRLPIGLFGKWPIDSWHLSIGNLRPTRYRVVVLTSWDRELECLPRVEPLTNDEKL